MAGGYQEVNGLRWPWAVAHGPPATCHIHIHTHTQPLHKGMLQKAGTAATAPPALLQLPWAKSKVESGSVGYAAMQHSELLVPKSVPDCQVVTHTLTHLQQQSCKARAAWTVAEPPTSWQQQWPCGAAGLLRLLPGGCLYTAA